jgi:hypothetical protein
MNLCSQGGLKKEKLVCGRKTLYKRLLTVFTATCFGRFYINSDAREAYFQLCKTFFELVNDLLPATQFLGWYHLHGFGLKAIVADMCSKQASGM